MITTYLILLVLGFLGGAVIALWRRVNKLQPYSDKIIYDVDLRADISKELNHVYEKLLSLKSEITADLNELQNNIDKIEHRCPGLQLIMSFQKQINRIDKEFTATHRRIDRIDSNRELTITGLIKRVQQIEAAELIRKGREGMPLTCVINKNPFENIHVPGFTDKDD